MSDSLDYSACSGVLLDYPIGYYSSSTIDSGQTEETALQAYSESVVNKAEGEMQEKGNCGDEWCRTHYVDHPEILKAVAVD